MTRSTAEMAKSNSYIQSPSLTTDDFVDFPGFHARNERAVLERSLDTFLQVYEEKKEECKNYIRKGKLNDSSTNFLLAIQFLRHFKCHYRELTITEHDINTALRKEVLGLMASILQVIMNAKKLSEEQKKRVRDIFLGNNMRTCLKESRLENKDFVYQFPKLFLEQGNFIKGDWFNTGSAKIQAQFDSSHIEADVNDFVTTCFVQLYYEHLQAKFPSADYEKAVGKLDSNKNDESPDMQQQTSTRRRVSASNEPKYKKRKRH